MREYKSRAMRSAHGIAQDLYASGVIDNTTMRSFDESCLTEIAPLGKEDIIAIRTADHASQAVFARYLGVSVRTVSSWEQGLRTPDGPASKLLTLAKIHGLDYIK